MTLLWIPVWDKRRLPEYLNQRRLIDNLMVWRRIFG